MVRMEYAIGGVPVLSNRVLMKLDVDHYDFKPNGGFGTCWARISLPPYWRVGSRACRGHYKTPINPPAVIIPHLPDTHIR